ncbi:MAG: hypothetical protein HC815_05585 [Richelia sp. RM1_1_1]|nr:hypothetical protein [Richelia sp. RM1_1_1]
MKFPRTSRTKVCPICGTHKSKCGWQADNPDLRFCMSAHDERSAPPGWKYVGETKGGLWGMFVPDTQQEYTEEERTAYKQRQAQQELKRRLSQAQSLSESERDRNHTKLLNQLFLYSHHCEDLRRRGLSDELIRAGKFRSIDQFHKLDFEVSYNLAGVDISGSSLTNYVTGYIVPVWNEYFQIIGYQIRNDNNAEDAPKYVWATSKRNKRRRKPASSHLQNGEIPLTFCVPISILDNSLKLSKNLFQGVEPLPLQNYSAKNNRSDKLKSCINLSEGILKAWIIAQLREVVVIGAAGGNFTSSPELLKRYVESASVMLGNTKESVLWADAGAIANPHVMRQYRKIYYLLKRWGYTLKVAWWGQIDKNCLDGDEYLGEYELLTWGQFEGLSRHPNRFWDSVKKEIGKIKRCLRRTPITPNFSLESSKSENKLEYVPGFLPTYGEYVDMGCPLIIYKNDERVTIWTEAVTKGWSHILDKSAPGLGKSHTAGTLSAEDLGMNQLMYLACDHRNPTTLTIEKNFRDVFPRHGGLYYDESRLTPNNRPFLIHPTASSNEKKMPSNCSRHHVFTATRSKNLNLESSKNIICQGCNLLHKCQTGNGNGYGYLLDRIYALKHSRIRLHPDSAPLPENFDYSQVGIFWDEASVLMRSKKKIEVRLSDLHQTVGYQATASDFEQLESDSILINVYKVVFELFELSPESLPRYGLNDSSIVERFGKTPQDKTRELIADLVERLSPNLDFLVELSDAVEYSPGKKGIGKFNRLLRDKHNKEIKNKLESLPLNWLVPMLEVWAGYVPGYFSFNNGVFTIHQFDSRHCDVARSSAFNVYLDGTMRTENLSLKLGIPKEHILVVETELPDYSNLEIVHIPEMGVLGRDRRETQQVRVELMREAIVKLESSNNILPEDIGCIERKAFARDGDGYHFRDSRGINRFSDKKVLIGIGAPYANIGEMVAEYGLLMKAKRKREGNDKVFNPQFLLNLICNLKIVNIGALYKVDYTEQDFIEGLVRAEILQEIGRLRSHLRLNEPLIYYFIGEYDLSPILEELPGIKYTIRQTAEISPMSVGGEERTKLMVITAIGSLLSQGIISPLQRQVESELENYSPIGKVKQERISQLMQELGGWSQAVNLIKNTLSAVALDEEVPATDNHFDDDWIIKVYFPLISQNTVIKEPVTAVRELIEVASVYGWVKFKEFIIRIEHGLQQKIIELVLYVYSLIDTLSLEEFIESG